MSISPNDLAQNYADTAALLFQCAEHIRRHGGQSDAVATKVLNDLARTRGLIITFSDERAAA